MIWFRSGNYKKSKGWEGVMGANWKHGMMHSPRWGEVWSLNMKKKRLLRDDWNRMNERYHKVKGKNVKHGGWRILNTKSDMPFEIELLYDGKRWCGWTNCGWGCLEKRNIWYKKNKQKSNLFRMMLKTIPSIWNCMKNLFRIKKYVWEVTSKY